MAVFLWDEFNTLVTTFSISRAFIAKILSKKATQQQARERNADLARILFTLFTGLSVVPASLRS